MAGLRYIVVLDTRVSPTHAQYLGPFSAVHIVLSAIPSKVCNR
jgi:hypothetical protein